MTQYKKNNMWMIYYIFLILLLPLVDTINGMINQGANTGIISLGIVYRFAIMGSSVYFIFQDFKFDIGKLLIGFIIFLSIPHVIFNNNRVLFVNLVLRLLLPMVIIIVFKSFKVTTKFRLEVINKIITVWSILLPITILIPYILGIGFGTYGSNNFDVGYKSFYYAQNDLGYFLIILYVISIYRLKTRFNKINLLITIMLFISGVLTGLKSVYAIYFIASAYYMFKSINKKYRLYTGLVLVITIAIFVIFYGKLMNNMIQRWTYFYKNSSSIVSFITSTRSDRIFPAISKIIMNYPLGILFGVGVEYLKYTPSMSLIEMDLFDIYFQLGIFGFIAVYLFYFKQLYRKITKIGFILVIVTIIYSTIVGHVLETALSGMVLSIVVLYSRVGDNSVAIKEDKNMISKMKLHIKFIMLYFRIKKTKTKNSLVILGTPTHGNIGDQAIIYAEQVFIKETMDFDSIVEIPSQFVIPYIKVWKNMFATEKCITLHGGGFMGTLWPEEDKMMRTVLTEFKDKKIVIFPQTIYFEEKGEKLDSFNEILDKCVDTTIFVREHFSLEFVNKYLSKNVAYKLVPDIVIYTDKEDYEIECSNREGCLFAIRNDKEKIDNNELLNLIEKDCINYSISVDITDTVVPHSIFEKDRKEQISKKISQFGQYKLVVTDRLHGMIFAAIAETPCIVLSNNNYKIKGVYEWVKDNSFIYYCTSKEDVENALKNWKNLGHFKYDNTLAQECLLQIKEVIKNERCE